MRSTSAAGSRAQGHFTRERRSDANRAKLQRAIRWVYASEPLERRVLLASAPHLVTDINQLNLSSGPGQITDVNGVAFFAANDSVGGRELWKSDGTPAGTIRVADINPGAAGSDPRYLVNVNGTLFFTATDGVHGAELWRSDGTVKGTKLVSDIAAGSGTSGPLTSYPQQLTNVNGTLFFTADDGAHGRELWKSDGTPRGTVMVKDITPGSQSSFASGPRALTAVGSTLFFVDDDGVSGTELWKSNGTSAGTVRVTDLGPGANGAYFSYLTNVNGRLFFTSATTFGGELWTSDGTAAGTLMIKDINPQGDSRPRDLTAVGSTLFFTASDGTHGRELWKSNGTAAGTVLVKDIYPSSGEYYPAPTNLTNFNGVLFFTDDDGTGAGRELWRSNGTAAGTFRVKDISPFGGSYPAELTVVGNTLFFAANDGTTGPELWKTNGTSIGTAFVKDINPGPQGSISGYSYGGAAAVGGKLFFTATDGTHNTELWVSDGTAAGTFMPRDIQTGTADATRPDQYYPSPVDVNGTLFFVADDGIHGTELWKSDGTAGGTVMVKNINPADSSYGSAPVPRDLINVNGTLFFTADDGEHGRELWISNGTEAGTVMVKDIRTTGFYSTGSNPGNFAVVGGTLYFSANDGVNGAELWKSNGTEAGTVMVKDINPNSSPYGDPYGSYPGSLTAFNGILMFSADDGLHGQELWRSNGTEAGTVLVKDINPTGGSSARYPTVVGSTVFFIADDGTHGTELWRSNGTSAGTALVRDIVAGPASSAPFSLTASNGTLFFAATTAAGGRELWRSNGTALGTAMIKDINPGSASSYPFDLTSVNGTVYFSAYDGTSGNELWKSDGTAAGTVRVSDIRAGAKGSYPSNLTAANGKLYFTAVDGIHGRELWTSDGTTAGTVLVADINPLGSTPYYQPGPFDLTQSGNTLFFFANDGVHGTELWALGL